VYNATRQLLILTGAIAERHEFILTEASGHFILPKKREKPRTRTGKTPLWGKVALAKLLMIKKG